MLFLLQQLSFILHIIYMMINLHHLNNILFHRLYKIINHFNFNTIQLDILYNSLYLTIHIILGNINYHLLLFNYLFLLLNY